MAEFPEKAKVVIIGLGGIVGAAVAHHLIQRGWTRREGTDQTYLQVIGCDRIPGSEPADAITGRLYSSHGDTLSYVCELEGDTMTIWMGEKGSPAVYRGTFSADGNTIEGEWEWPGGGYRETMTRAHVAAHS